jgi:hypothetical protein
LSSSAKSDCVADNDVLPAESFQKYTLESPTALRALHPVASVNRQNHSLLLLKQVL